MTGSACNGDSGYQGYPNRSLASASSLCGQPENTLSVSETGSGASMAVDAEGNLYVTDFWNHRVLKYNTPFSADAVADDVWGQDNFQANACNKTLPFPEARMATSVETEISLRPRVAMRCRHSPRSEGPPICRRCSWRPSS